MGSFRFFSIFRCWESGDPRLFDLILPILIELRANIKLNCEVSWSDSLDIPFDIIILLSLLNIVNIVDDKESDEYSATSDEQALFFTINE